MSFVSIAKHLLLDLVTDSARHNYWFVSVLPGHHLSIRFNSGRALR